MIFEAKGLDKQESKIKKMIFYKMFICLLVGGLLDAQESAYGSRDPKTNPPILFLFGKK